MASFLPKLHKNSTYIYIIVATKSMGQIKWRTDCKFSQSEATRSLFPSKTIVKQSKKENKDQESIQSSTTPDPGYQWESDNVTIRHNKQEPRGQPFPSR